MTLEGRETDKKSLRVLEGKAGAIAGLTHDCVAFANCVGRRLLIGIEDDQDEPPANQRVDRVWLERLPQRISQLTLNVGVAASVETARNGGEYLELRVARNAQTIAATSDGRYFIRAADETKPLLPDELGRLMSDKTAYVWETQTTRLWSASSWPMRWRIAPIRSGGIYSSTCIPTAWRSTIPVYCPLA